MERLDPDVGQGNPNHKCGGMAGDARTSPRALLQAGDWPAARRACERALAAAGPEAGARLAREGLVRALLELGEAPLALEAVDAGLAGAASGQGAGWGGPAPWHTGQKLKVEALLAIGEYGEAAALAAALEGALPNPSAARRALQAVRERVERAAGAAATEKLRGNAAFRSGDMAGAAMHYRTGEARGRAGTSGGGLTFRGNSPASGRRGGPR